MITYALIIIVSYIVIGIGVGRWMYNGLLDDVYQDKLKIHTSGDHTEMWRQDKAYQAAKRSLMPTAAGIVLGFFWPVVPIAMCIMIVFDIIKWIVSRLPKGEAEKQYLKRQEQKKELDTLRQRTDELVKSIQVLKEANVETEEAEAIVQSNRAKLQSIAGS